MIGLRISTTFSKIPEIYTFLFLPECEPGRFRINLYKNKKRIKTVYCLKSDVGLRVSKKVYTYTFKCPMIQKLKTRFSYPNKTLVIFMYFVETMNIFQWKFRNKCLI